MSPSALISRAVVNTDPGKSNGTNTGPFPAAGGASARECDVFCAAATTVRRAVITNQESVLTFVLPSGLMCVLEERPVFGTSLELLFFTRSDVTVIRACGREINRALRNRYELRRGIDSARCVGAQLRDHLRGRCDEWDGCRLTPIRHHENFSASRPRPLDGANPRRPSKIKVASHSRWT
jgi:hypothetical protein